MTGAYLGLVCRRLAVLVPMALLVILASFLIMRAVPGGPFDQAKPLAPVVRLNLERRYGLDRPLPVQFLRYARALAGGDLGDSLSQPGARVGELLAAGAPVSLRVGSLALLLAIGLGVPLGLLSAYRDGDAAGGALKLLTAAGLAIPTFVLGPALVLVFGLWLGWLPVAGYSGRVAELVLPAVTLGAVPLFELARLTRLAAGLVTAEPYVRAARLRGVAERTVLVHYVLPPVLRPVVAYLGPLAAGILAGSLVVERVFALPGTGSYLVAGALARDYPLVLGATLVYLVLVVVLSLVAELIAFGLDPALRRHVATP